MFAEGNRADDIGTAHDPNNFISLHHREAFDLVRRHELSDLFDRGLFVDADDLLAHERPNVFTPFGEDIGFGHNTDDLTVLGGYRRTTDLILDQRHRQIFHGHRWSHGDDISGHYVFGNHLQFPPRPTLKNCICRLLKKISEARRAKNRRAEAYSTSTLEDRKSTRLNSSH